MFQNSTLPSVSVDITRNIAGSIPRFRTWQGLARLNALVPLPRTFREYLAWLLILIGMTALALLQVWATLQIRQTEMEVSILRDQYLLVEQENAQLLWEISHYTTLERVEVEATAAGFVPALNRRYVQANTMPASYSTLPVNAPAENQEREFTMWSVDLNTNATQIDGQLSSLWKEWTMGWADQWQKLSQSMMEGVGTLGSMAEQQWMKIDMSRFLWLENPTD